MKKILIIGGAGFIGFAIAKKILKNNIVYILDLKKKIKKIKKIKSQNVKIMTGDISKYSTFKKLNSRFDIVYYLSAKTSAKISEFYPEQCFDTNLIGTINLYKWAKKYKPKKIIFSSSMSVYGEVGNFIDENSYCEPVSFYGISKLGGEKILLKLKQLNIKVFIYRLFNVYGPGQNYNNLDQGMLSIYLAQAVNNNKVYVTGSLKRYRDFIYIDDVVNALTKSIKYKKNDDNIYNIGSGKKTYVYQILDKIFNLLKIKKKIIVQKGHSGDPWGMYANNKKMLNKGWKIKTDLKKGLELTINDINK